MSLLYEVASDVVLSIARSVVSFILFILFDESHDYDELFKLTHVSRSTLTIGTMRVPLISLLDHNTPTVRDAIHDFKYRQAHDATSVLAQILGDELLDIYASHNSIHPGVPFYIIPIPSSKRRIAERGFDHLAVLLNSITEAHPELASHTRTDILLKTRHTKPQTKLTRSQRKNNIRNSFSLSGDAVHLLNNASVIIIDDVTTTGATIAEAAKTLQKAQPMSISALTLAHPV